MDVRCAARLRSGVRWLAFDKAISDCVTVSLDRIITRGMPFRCFLNLYLDLYFHLSGVWFGGRASLPDYAVNYSLLPATY